MMKIAVIVYDLTLDYNISVLRGIISFFEGKKDVAVYISPIYLLDYNNDAFEFQYRSSAEVLASKDIDAYIIIPNTFGSYISFEKLAEELKIFSKKPVFTVGTPLNFPDNYSTYNSCEEAYENIVKHLSEKHNCKKIAFCSAGKVNSEESETRLAAFKKGMSKIGLEFDEDLHFKSDFTPGYTCELLLERYKSKEEVNFDAIVCANDFMAAGCLLAFMKLNIKVPDDVIVVGFDNNEISLATYPTLSTIDQYVEHSGYVAGEMAYKVLSGEKIDRKGVIHSFPIYRQSCGCIKDKIHSTSYYDKDGMYHELDEEHVRKNYDAYLYMYTNLNSIYKLLNRLDANVSLEDTQKKIIPSLETANVSYMAICLYDKIQSVSETTPFVLPEKVQLATMYNLVEGKIVQDESSKNQFFNPKKKILPPSAEKDQHGIFYLFPLFLQEQNYGYVVCKFQDRNFVLISVYFKILSNIIIQGYEYTKEIIKKEELVDRNQKLNFQSKTDELTQLFNRRGFLEYGQRLVDLSTATGSNGIVIFGDMDGLKTINDTYGHKIGDLTIKTCADVMKKSFHESDLIGRLSGDEFAVIAPGFRWDKIDNLRERMTKNFEDMSKAAGLPFILSMSLGPVEYSENKTDLQALLLEADKELYKEKEIKHAKRDAK